MTKVLSGVDTVIKWIEDTVSIVTLASIVGIVTIGVIGRYIFHFGILWADEVNQALLVAMGMFGSAKAVRLDRHTVFTSFVSNRKSKKVRFLMRLVITIITLLCLVMLLSVSAQYALDGTMKSVVLRVPRMYYYVSIPLGFALCIYEYIRTFKSKVIDDTLNEN
jgi:TRAP-type C4-dicarboxylate transport system permease small subunit